MPNAPARPPRAPFPRGDPMPRFFVETAEKLGRLRSALKAHRLDGVVLCTRANFAWLTGGGDNHVVSQSEEGVGALVVTQRSAVLCTGNIEAQRFVDEEPVAGFTLR